MIFAPDATTTTPFATWGLLGGESWCRLEGSHETKPTDLSRCPTRVEASERPSMKRALIVEDSPLLAELTMRRLERRFVCERASDGEAAREHLAAGEMFDLVICDVTMPRLDGLGLLEWMRRFRPDLVRCVIFATATPDHPSARQIAEGHMHPLLVKPVSRGALDNAISRVVSPELEDSEGPATLRHSSELHGAEEAIEEDPVEAMARALLDACIELQKESALDGHAISTDELAKFAMLEEIRRATEDSEAVQRRLIELASDVGEPFARWLAELFERSAGRGGSE